MKNSSKVGAVILLIALMAGFCVFIAVRSHKSPSAHGALIDDLPELEWCRTELNLSTEQFEKVRELHVAYRPECEEMCDRIRDTHIRLEEASQGAEGVTPELKAAIADHARIHAECQEAMLEHLYETAAVLDENQAERYLKMMLPFALDFSHSEPGGVHGE